MAAVELATGYVALIPSARNITANIVKELGGPVEAAAAQSGSRASAGFAGRFSAGTKGLGAKLGKSIGIGLLGGGALAGAGVGLLAHIGATLDSANDIIRSKTGQTGGVLKGLDKSFNNVFKTVPASADDVATALSSINQRLGITGKPLEALTRQVLQLSHVTGTDLQTNLSGIVPLLAQWNVKGTQTTGVVDEIFRASQKSGVAVSDLSSQLVGSGVQLRAAGFDLNHSVGLLALLGKSGLSASDVVPAISRSLAQAAKAGKPAAKFFHDTFNQIQHDASDTKAAGDAVTVFGTRAGPKLAALIRSGKLSYEDFTKSISKGDTIAKAAKDTFDWQEKFQILKNKALVVIAPLANRVFNAIGTGADIAGAAMSKAFGPGGIGTRALTAVRGVIARIDFGAIFAKGAAAVSAIVPKLQAAFTQLVGAVSKIDFGAIFAQAGRLIPPLVLAIGAIAAAVLKLASAALPVLVSAFKTGFSIVVRVMPTVIAGLRVVAGVVTFLAKHFQTLKPILFAVAGGFAALKVVRTVNAGIVGVTKTVTGSIAGFKKLRTEITGYGSAIKNGVSTVGRFAKSIFEVGKNALTAALNIGKQVAAFVAQKAAAVASAIATKALAAGQWLLNAAMDANPITLIVLAIAALAAGFVLAYQHITPFRNAVDALGRAFLAAFNWVKSNWPKLLLILTGPFGIAVLLIKGHFSSITGFAGKAFGKIGGFAKAGFHAVTGAISDAFNWVKSHWPLLLAILTGPIGIAVLLLKGHWQTIKTDVATVFNAVKHAFNNVVSFVRGVPGRIASVASGMWDGIKDAFKSAINFVIDGWNSLQFSLPSVTIFHHKFGGFTLGTPDIPRLATGGVFTEPTLALVGETTKARPEITTPGALLRSIVGSELKKHDSGGLAGARIDKLQENHFHGYELTRADLDYAGRELAWSLRRTGQGSGD